VWAEGIFALDLAVCNFKQHGFVTNIPTTASTRSRPHKSNRQKSASLLTSRSPHVVSHQIQTRAHWVSLHSEAGQEWSFAFILCVMCQRLVLMWRTAFDGNAAPWRRKRMCAKWEMLIWNCVPINSFASERENIRDHHQRSTNYFQGLNVHEFRN